jgi:unsaturated rhamnogalacturonyl hydrolase
VPVDLLEHSAEMRNTAEAYFLRKHEDGNVIIGNICIGTGIGDYAHYVARPTSDNDLHGAGAFILMCVEMSLAQRLA